MNHSHIHFIGTPQELIKSVRGHVGIFVESETNKNRENFTVTARVNTAEGISCRIVADCLPDYAAALSRPWRMRICMLLFTRKKCKGNRQPA